MRTYRLSSACPRCGADVIVTPGDPGCRMTTNGDGWPPTAPTAECEGGCDLNDEEQDAAAGLADDRETAAMEAAAEARADRREDR